MHVDQGLSIAQRCSTCSHLPEARQGTYGDVRLGSDAVEKVSFLLIASDWRGIEIGESLGGGSGLIVPWVSGNRRARERDEWTKGSKRQGLQVLYDGREKKFVAGPREPAEPDAFEAMVGLEVSKAHLDALAFIPRLTEALCPHESSQPYSGSIVL